MIHRSNEGHALNLALTYSQVLSSMGRSSEPLLPLDDGHGPVRAPVREGPLRAHTEARLSICSHHLHSALLIFPSQIVRLQLLLGLDSGSPGGAQLRARARSAGEGEAIFEILFRTFF